MFWKKKKEETPAIPIKEIKYTCLAVNYHDEIEIDGENLDDVKEGLFEQFKKLNKVYTRKEIDSITEKLGYDIWKSFIWVDYDIKANKNLDHKMNIQVLERWLGAKEDEHFEEVQTELEKHLNYSDFHKRTEIQNVAMKVGYDVYGRSDWQSYTQTTWQVPSKDINFTYYTKK